MADLVSVLKDTPLPTICVVAGIVFWLLAIAGSIAGKITVLPGQQKTAGVIGTLLVVLGTTLYLVPGRGSDRSSQTAPVSGSPVQTTPVTTTTVPITSVAPSPSAYAIAKDDVDIYNGPGGQYTVIGMMRANEFAVTIQRQEGWWHLKFPSLPNGSGWVAEDHLTVTSTKP